jgi:hypothetical protein
LEGCTKNAKLYIAGCLEPFPCIQSIVDEQSMAFKDGKLNELKEI